MISPLFKYPGLRLGTVVLTILLLVACGDDAPPEKKEIIRPVKLMTLDAGGIGATVEYPGEVSAARSVELGFEVAGKIIELPISDGLAVKQAWLLSKARYSVGSMTLIMSPRAIRPRRIARRQSRPMSGRKEFLTRVPARKRKWIAPCAILTSPGRA
jgi:hypothetical protein